MTRGRISVKAVNTYLSWFKSDLMKIKRSTETAKRIVKALIEKAPSPVSWHNIAKEFELRSHTTVYQYIHLFQELFVAKILHYIDPKHLQH